VLARRAPARGRKRRVPDVRRRRPVSVTG
jgi:hypothetical protein